MAEPDRQLSPDEAQAMHDASGFTAWVLTGCDPRFPGNLVARANSTTPEGGQLLGAVLVADTLEALRAQLPRGVSPTGSDVPSPTPCSTRTADISGARPIDTRDARSGQNRSVLWRA